MALLAITRRSQASANDRPALAAAPGKAATVGFGKGSFGHGQFGLDADTIEWTSPPLSQGVYRFGVKVRDKSGMQSSTSETEPITVVPAATPAEGLSISSFDKQTNQLILTVGNSR